MRRAGAPRLLVLLLQGHVWLLYRTAGPAVLQIPAKSAGGWLEQVSAAGARVGLTRSHRQWQPQTRASGKPAYGVGEGASVARNLLDGRCCGKAGLFSALCSLLLWYRLWDWVCPAQHRAPLSVAPPFYGITVGESPALTLVFSDSSAAAAGVCAGWDIMLVNNNTWPSRTRTLLSNTFKEKWQSV